MSAIRTVMAIVCCLLAGCAARTSSTVADLSIAFAARTALVNDPMVGTAPIDLQVQNGVATLDGRVATTQNRERAEALVANVDGVVRVVNRLSVSTEAAVGVATQRDGPGTLVPDESPVGRHLAAGAVVQMSATRNEIAENAFGAMPVFRFGRGAGWHPVVSLTRLRTNLLAGPGADSVGQFRQTAITGGIGYSVTTGRWSFMPSLTAGVSLNSVSIRPGVAVPASAAWPVSVDNGAVLLPAATLWYQLHERWSIGTSVGYFLSRPGATWLGSEAFSHRRFDARSLIVGGGVAWWVF